MPQINYNLTKEVKYTPGKICYSFIPNYIVDLVLDNKDENSFLKLSFTFEGEETINYIQYSKKDLFKCLISRGETMPNKHYPEIGQKLFFFYKLELFPQNFEQEIETFLRIQDRYLVFLKKMGKTLIKEKGLSDFWSFIKTLKNKKHARNTQL